MSDLYQQKAAKVRFPFAVADNTTAKGFQRIACTGSAQTYALKDFQKNRYLHVRAISVEVQVALAGTAQALVLDQASSAAAATSSAAAGATLYAGEVFDKISLDAATHLCWISRTATGFVEFYTSED